MYSAAYNLGRGKVEIGMDILYFPPGKSAQAGKVCDITQDGDITVKLYSDNKMVTTKWRYVEPK